MELLSEWCCHVTCETCTCWRSERSSWWPSRRTMKLRSTFSRVTNDTRACAAGAPLGTPNPLRPGRSWKNARALRSRLMLAIVVRRQWTSLSGSELAMVDYGDGPISCSWSSIYSNRSLSRDARWCKVNYLFAAVRPSGSKMYDDINSSQLEPV